MMKPILKMLAWIIGVFVFSGILIVAGFLAYSAIMEYKPPPVEPGEITEAGCSALDTSLSFSLITWNIGYGGLGKEMDFFYDGGTRVRPDSNYFRQSCNGILRFLKAHDSVDFFLLQEVDIHSKRSYYLDEIDWLSDGLSGFCRVFATNYNCRFVPVPVSNPMGRVYSGMSIFSRFRVDSADRNSFDKHMPWPGRLFYMKRCFLTSRFFLPDDRQLVLVNIHNSAFDTGGILRKREMEMIRKFMIHEYKQGNYLVAGGDWNANPPGFRPEMIRTGDRIKQVEFTDLNEYFPGWTFAFDPTAPTNRNVDTPYEHGVTPTTIIDFFLVSPNVEVIAAETFNTGFSWSDHQPVYLRVRFK